MFATQHILFDIMKPFGITKSAHAYRRFNKSNCLLMHFILSCLAPLAPLRSAPHRAALIIGGLLWFR